MVRWYKIRKEEWLAYGKVRYKVNVDTCSRNLLVKEKETVKNSAWEELFSVIWQHKQYTVRTVLSRIKLQPFKTSLALTFSSRLAAGNKWHQMLHLGKSWPAHNISAKTGRLLPYANCDMAGSQHRWHYYTVSAIAHYQSLQPATMPCIKPAQLLDLQPGLWRPADIAHSLWFAPDNSLYYSMLWTHVGWPLMRQFEQFLFSLQCHILISHQI